MMIIEQVGMRTDQIDAQLDMFARLQQEQWVRDTVDAVHLYKHHSIKAMLGDFFRVHLAFNYDFLPGQELEITQLLSGMTWPFLQSETWMTHVGYHTEQNQLEVGEDTLLKELKLLQAMGLTVMQVSQTIRHVNTERFYRFAYLTGGLTGGVPVRVIQRLIPKKHTLTTVDAGKALFDQITEWI